MKAKLDAIRKLPQSEWKKEMVALQVRLDKVFSRSNYPQLYGKDSEAQWRNVVGL